MDTPVKVRVKEITKEFEMYKTRSDKIKALLTPGRSKVPTFWALKGVSFEAHAGEALGLIGINGSGKSTVSNVISGIIPPTSGELEVNGDVSIIAIGAGLKAQLTGLQNIRVKALMSGLTNKEIDQIIQDVIDFADIGDFINQPVKNYSSGMRSRLGFAIAIHQKPDILIVDEALSVGDQTFYEKCMEKMMQFKAEGKTIIFVSHALNQVETFCDRVVWMHYGDVREQGDTATVLDHYREFTTRFNKLSATEKKAYQAQKKEDQKDFSLEELQTRDANDVTPAQASKIFQRNRVGDKMSFSMIVIMLAMLVALFFAARWSVRTLDHQQVVEQAATAQLAATRAAEYREKTALSTPNGQYKIKAEHKVTADDTLADLATKYDVSAARLKAANDLKDDTLTTGRIIYIPYDD
ncbi:ATP-binding cassette domain-containing protein [Lacticaseibacillus yichunensis]|uniref:ATP-binding cassette domain-containing protein n=1 Tax=Lacticaseibacillus yichunensis TaxID=2486015 RepID=A0ABW4CQ84_9LACO